MSEPTGAPAADSYRDYEVWKGWDKTFVFSAEDDEFFSGETRSLAIAGASVLEIGFGNGSFLAWARSKGASVAGTELNSVLQEAARKAGVELVSTDLAEAARGNAGRFDTIAAFDVFEHLTASEIVAALGSCETMMKPGSHLILRFPNGQSPLGLAPQNGDPTHRTALSRSIFEVLMRGRKFEIVRYGTPFRIVGALPKAFVRRARYAARDLIGASMNAIYGMDIPWDPVVTLVMRRTV